MLGQAKDVYKRIHGELSRTLLQQKEVGIPCSRQIAILRSHMHSTLPYVNREAAGKGW